MFRLAVTFLGAVALFGADNPWTKVQELENRSELHIYKRGTSEPINATLFEVTNEKLIVALKDRQLTLAKEDIDRIDARPPAKSGAKPTVQTTAKTTEPDLRPRPNAGAPVPGTEYGSNVSFGGAKGDFKMIYKRPAAAPKK